MIQENIKELITLLGFSQQSPKSKVWCKKYPKHDNYVILLDFEKSFIDYGSKIQRGDDTTSNFSRDENFVVLECVNRLLEKGYKPQSLTLEKRWRADKKTAGIGKSDITITDLTEKTLIIIECKTWGEEYKKQKNRIIENGGQLFQYYKQDTNCKFLCLYTSCVQIGKIEKIHDLIQTFDTDEDKAKQKKIDKPITYGLAKNVEDFLEVWKTKSNKTFLQTGIFEDDVEPYNPGYVPLRIKDLKEFTLEDAKKEYNEFEEILRHNNISDRSNAFNRFISLVLAKIKDEEKGKEAIAEFQVKEGIDDAESLIERLQTLYTLAMQGYLNENVINHTFHDIEKIISYFPRQTSKEDLKRIYRELKFYTNNEFSFKEIYNQELFEQNAKVVFEIVKRLQPLRFRYTSKAQFLGDFFEDMLESGFKQSEGQFFTPTPIAKFIVSAIPLREIIEEKIKHKEIRILPSVIDYACGSGHFITESIEEIQNIIITFDDNAHDDLPGYKQSTRWAGDFICGIEKDYRLARTSQVACFMHGDGDAKIIYGDGLEDHTYRFPDAVKRGDKLLGFDVLVANPPYSIKEFYRHLSFEKLPDYEILKEFEDKNSKEIEALFVERTKQLLKVGGYAGIFLPSTILNSTGIYTKAREIILKYFEIKGIVEFGSNTFSATSTNTIVLFMRRRSDDFSKNCRYIAEDFILGIDFERQSDFLDSYTLYKHYTALIGINHDDYVSLTKRNPSKELTETEFYMYYYKAWENLAETKRVRQQIEKLKEEKKKFHKSDNKEVEKKKQNEQKIETLEKSLVNDWFDFILETECEKFEYFLMSHRQVDDINEIFWEEQELEDGSIKKIKHLRKRFIPQQTLIVKSGKDNETQKSFLGYTFSDRRGYKGLDMKKNANGKEITKLYDKENLRNPEKVNTYIYKAFREEAITEIDENLKEHIALLNLVDTFDFERVVFEKQINTMKAKKTEFQSKFELQTLGSLVDFQSGLWIGKKPPFKMIKVIRNTNFKLNNGKLDLTNVAEIKVEEKQFDTRLLEYGDIILEKSGGSDTQAIGRVVLFEEKSGEYSFSNFCSRIRVKDKNKINPVFLWAVLHKFYLEGGTEALQNGIRLLNIDFDGYKNIKIPVPPKDIQDKIVKEIEQVEKEENNALTQKQKAISKIETSIRSITHQDAIGNISKLRSEKVEPQTLKDKTGNYIGLEHIDSNTGKLIANWQPTINLTIKSTKNKFYKGDLLYGKLRPYLNKVWIAEFDGYCSTDILVLLTECPLVLKRILLSEDFVKRTTSLMKGMSLPRLEVKQFKEMKIQYPTQNEIKEMEKSFAQLDNEIYTAEETLTKAVERKMEILKTNLQY
ncbi:MAG: N-6 DNA methylase [Bacteroidia bacterium]|nr:N-6 DNA methylase [Bacteroidia bacterium]